MLSEGLRVLEAPGSESCFDDSHPGILSINLLSDLLPLEDPRSVYLVLGFAAWYPNAAVH